MPHRDNQLPMPSIFDPEPGIVQINLHDTNSFTRWILVAGKFSMSADILIRSGKTWALAVVGMEWSVSNGNYVRANTFSPVVSFTSAIQAISNIDIASLVYVRFRVTTAEAANDSAAKIIYMVE